MGSGKLRARVNNPAKLRETASGLFALRQFQRRPETWIFLVGQGAADGESLLAQFAVDHGIGEAQTRVLLRIETSKCVGWNVGFQQITIFLQFAYDTELLG